jgi:DNA-binding transcriptional ArsR family regulator
MLPGRTYTFNVGAWVFGEAHGGVGTASIASAHLSILREGGMATSWRSGRSVMYRRTPLAETVLAAMSGRAATGSA